jgi:hypothetical protein
MKKTILAAVAAAMLVGFAGQAQAMSGMDAMNHPPKGFVKVSDALKNPGMAWIPGLGTLYIDPSTLAQGGPFLGYDKKGHLVNVTYMFPLKALNEHHDFTNLGTSVMGLKIDHTDVTVSKAHPGVMEEHIHVINWLISHDKAMKELGEYPLGFGMTHGGHEGHMQHK